MPIFLLTILCLGVGRPRAEELYNVEAQSLLGFTGYVLAPSARTLNYRETGLALHRFMLGLAYGWPREAEFGVSFDLKEVTPITPFARATYRARAPFFSFHGKYRWLREARHHWDVSFGVWRHTYYTAIAPQSWRGWRLEAAPSVRRRSDETHQFGAAGALSYTAGVQRFFADYDSQFDKAALGWRYLLSDAIRMDLFLTGLGDRVDFFDRFFFGLTIAGRP